MNNVFASRVIQFIADHFEILFYGQVTFIAMFLLVLAAVWLSQAPLLRILKNTFVMLASLIIVGGEIILLFLMGYLYWINYRHPVDTFHFPEEVAGDVTWVKEQLTVYFVKGNELYSIKISGKDQKNIFKAAHEIREYQFSPDGQYVLVVTAAEIHLIQTGTKESTRIDAVTLDSSTGLSELKGTISLVRWAPDSRKFCYKITQWSPYASVGKVFVYDVSKKENGGGLHLFK